MVCMAVSNGLGSPGDSVAEGVLVMPVPLILDVQQ